VRIRASTEYALQTVMHLAVADAGTTTARHIAADQDIPPRFLTQLRRMS
jgi:DNA-binding IscR family transcriptional regulator